MSEAYDVVMPSLEMAEGSGAFWDAEEWQVAAHRSSDEVTVCLRVEPVTDPADLVRASASARLWLDTGGGWFGQLSFS